MLTLPITNDQNQQTTDPPDLERREHPWRYGRGPERKMDPELAKALMDIRQAACMIQAAVERYVRPNK